MGEGGKEGGVQFERGEKVANDHSSYVFVN
jgi:hypothetical protein